MGWEETVIGDDELIGCCGVSETIYFGQVKDVLKEVCLHQAEPSYKAGYDARDKEIIAKSRQLGHGHSRADAILIARQEGRREVAAYLRKNAIGIYWDKGEKYGDME